MSTVKRNRFYKYRLTAHMRNCKVFMIVEGLYSTKSVIFHVLMQKEPSVREKMQLRMEVLAHAHVVCSTLNSAGSKVLLESFQLSQNQVPNPNAKVTRLQFTGVLIDEVLCTFISFIIIISLIFYYLGKYSYSITTYVQAGPEFSKT